MYELKLRMLNVCVWGATKHRIGVTVGVSQRSGHMVRLLARR